MNTLNNASETKLAKEDSGCDNGSESFNIPIPLSRTPRIYRISMMEDLSFDPTNLGQSPTTSDQHGVNSPCRYRHHSFTCHQLVFTSSNDESPVRSSVQCSHHYSTDARSQVHRRAELSSSVHHNLHHPITPTLTSDQFFTDAWDNDTTASKQNLPTAPLDDKVWSENLIPDRQLCIHKTSHEPNHQCSYPCPYRNKTFRMDLPQSTPQDEAVFH